MSPTSSASDNKYSCISFGLQIVVTWKLPDSKHHSAISECFHGHRIDLFGSSCLSFSTCLCTVVPALLPSGFTALLYPFYSFAPSVTPPLILCILLLMSPLCLCSFPLVMSALLLLGLKAQKICFLLLCGIWHNLLKLESGPVISLRLTYHPAIICILCCSWGN